MNEKGVQEKIDTRLNEQKADGSSYSYKALAKVPKGYSVVGKSNQKGTVTKDTTVVFTYKKNNYKITYKLSGGKNNKKNPASYTVTSAITLKKPTRTGYAFDCLY